MLRRAWFGEVGYVRLIRLVMTWQMRLLTLAAVGLGQMLSMPEGTSLVPVGLGLLFFGICTVSLCNG